MKQIWVRQWVAEKATTAQQGCRLLAISRAGFYVANRRLRQPKVLCGTRVRLQAVFEDSGRCYGSRRLQEALNDEGLDIGRFKVSSLMKELQLKPIWQRKFVHKLVHIQRFLDVIIRRRGKAGRDFAGK